MCVCMCVCLCVCMCVCKISDRFLPVILRGLGVAVACAWERVGVRAGVRACAWERVRACVAVAVRSSSRRVHCHVVATPTALIATALPPPKRSLPRRGHPPPPSFVELANWAE